jgi:16S rRNA (guanine1516-N2)-methyltransferase
MNIAIAYDDDSQLDKAQQLAIKLNLPLTTSDDTTPALLLVYTRARLELRYTAEKSPNPLFVDFVNGKVAHRYRYGGGKGQLIARALGLQKLKKPSVLDLTAGLGRDAFVLATLDCKMTLIERSPIIAALLEDGLNRAEHAAEWFKDLHLTLIHMEAQTYLLSLTEENKPDVIYIDPMFPHGKKSALVKIEMRILRDIVGDDPDAHLLLNCARSHAKRRVVVKRARHAPLLTNLEPDLVFKGKSSRFDVYFPKKNRNACAKSIDHRSRH